MSERIFAQAYVWDCPDDQKQAVLAVFERHGLHLEYAHEPEGELGPNLRYMDHEVPVGTANDVAKALIEEAPGASFVAWEDPSVEGLGGLHAYTPALGHFGGDYGADCTADGEVVFALSRIIAVIGCEDAQANGVGPALGRAMGRPWLDEWEQRGKTAGDQELDAAQHDVSREYLLTGEQPCLSECYLGEPLGSSELLPEFTTVPPRPVTHAEGCPNMGRMVVIRTITACPFCEGPLNPDGSCAASCVGVGDG